MRSKGGWKGGRKRVRKGGRERERKRGREEEREGKEGYVYISYIETLISLS